MSTKNKKIIIVSGLVLVFLIVLLIAIPSFVPSRTTTSKLSCRNQLLMLNNAVSKWAEAEAATNGTEITIEQVRPYFPGYVRGDVRCPDGGKYRLVVGQTPQCSLDGPLHSCPNAESPIRP